MTLTSLLVYFITSPSNNSIVMFKDCLVFNVTSPSKLEVWTLQSPKISEEVNINKSAGNSCLSLTFTISPGVKSCHSISCHDWFHFKHLLWLTFLSFFLRLYLLFTISSIASLVIATTNTRIKGPIAVKGFIGEPGILWRTAVAKKYKFGRRQNWKNIALGIKLNKEYFVVST